MSSDILKSVLFDRIDYEGFEGAADYFGKRKIIDDPEIDRIWNSFVPLYEDLKDFYEEWEELNYRSEKDW